ncbi:hypothetical protein OG21DRAFT_98570 [Imleria badia]|nr:hypothetical protein OG21DRAFT_98570 [Imleria badia]
MANLELVRGSGVRVLVVRRWLGFHVWAHLCGVMDSSARSAVRYSYHASLVFSEESGARGELRAGGTMHPEMDGRRSTLQGLFEGRSRLGSRCHGAIMMHDVHHGCSSSTLHQVQPIAHQHITHHVALGRVWVSLSLSVIRCCPIRASRAFAPDKSRRASFTAGDATRGPGLGHVSRIELNWQARARRKEACRALETRRSTC